jgi:outer membrane murein-binding lipoprotein Lpp
MKKRYLLACAAAAVSMTLLVAGCSNDDSGNGSGGSVSDLNAAWVAFNDCADNGGNDPNATEYGMDTSTQSWGPTSGPLLKISDGSDTGVMVEVNGDNLRTWNPAGTPQPGTDAYETFNGTINVDEIVSYGEVDVPYDWYFEATFTGLDPAKEYAFITTANRNNLDYSGEDAASRWTKFTIMEADTYTNISSSGVTKVSESVVKFNTGYNTENGYVAAWTDITAADGSFTVRSENVGSEGPGQPYRSYGMQAFALIELAE